jgi:hypothetical protein
LLLDHLGPIQSVLPAALRGFESGKADPKWSRLAEATKNEQRLIAGTGYPYDELLAEDKLYDHGCDRVLTSTPVSESAPGQLAGRIQCLDATRNKHADFYETQSVGCTLDGGIAITIGTFATNAAQRKWLGQNRGMWRAGAIAIGANWVVESSDPYTAESIANTLGGHNSCGTKCQPIARVVHSRPTPAARQRPHK